MLLPVAASLIDPGPVELQAASLDPSGENATESTIPERLNTIFLSLTLQTRPAPSVPAQASLEHTVDRVATPTPYSKYLDVGKVGYFNICSHSLRPPFSEAKML